MRTMRKLETQRRLLFARLGMVALSAAVACSPGDDSSGDDSLISDSRTGNWTLSCTSSDGCGDSLSCICGMCTVSCAVATCPNDLACLPVPTLTACPIAEPVDAICAAACADDSDCVQDEVCTAQLCVRRPRPCPLETPPESSVFPGSGDVGDACTCSAASPECGATLQARVVAIDGVEVRVALRAAPGSGVALGGSTWSAFVDDAPTLECTQLDGRPIRATGVVPDDVNVTEVIVPVLVQRGERDALPAGDAIYLTFTATLPGDAPTTIFTSVGLPLTRVCEAGDGGR